MGSKGKEHELLQEALVSRVQHGRFHASIRGAGTALMSEVRSFRAVVGAMLRG